MFLKADMAFSVSNHHYNTDELTSLFYSSCENALDIAAPFRTMRAKPKSEPWLNDTTHAARHECRRAERQWTKDRLQVSSDILKDSLFKYQKTVKMEKSRYFSNVIAKNSHKPRVLFNTINSVLNTSQQISLEFSKET